MKILLYGGTFDPPHNGHLNYLRAAVRRVQPDKVIVMPAGVPPHKHASTTPGILRIEMCRCFEALAEENAALELEVSSWEVEQAAAGRRNYTVLTLEWLAKRFPAAQLYLTVGSDMLMTFDEWYRWADILRLAHLVVVSRNVGDDPALHAKAKQLDPEGGRILFAPVEAMPMASSSLRQRLAAGDDCENELPANVRAVIAREGLYRNQGDEESNEVERGKRACTGPSER